MKLKRTFGWNLNYVLGHLHEKVQPSGALLWSSVTDIVIWFIRSWNDRICNTFNTCTEKKPTKSTTMWHLLGLVPNKPTFLTSGEQMSIIFQLIAQPSVGLLGFHFLTRNGFIFCHGKNLHLLREKRNVKTRVASLQTEKRKNSGTTSRDEREWVVPDRSVGQNHKTTFVPSAKREALDLNRLHSKKNSTFSDLNSTEAWAICYYYIIILLLSWQR